MVTRFNNKTYNELINYKVKKNISGGFYGAPTRVSPDIPIKAKMFVLEMNNDTNTIMGISIIKNYYYLFH